MKNRIQKLPPCMWGAPQNDKGSYCYFFDGDIQTITAKDRPNKYHKCATPEEAFRLVARAHNAGKMAIACAFVEEDKQNEIISFSEVGIYENMVRCHNIVASVERAKKLVFKDGLPKV